METSSTNEGQGLKEAIGEFGSLSAANQHLEKENISLSKENTKLKKDNHELLNTNKTLIQDVDNLKKTLGELRGQVSDIEAKLLEHKREYDLFCGFLAMVVESPSVTESVDDIIAIFQKLKESGWNVTADHTELRSIFVRTIMGDYLKCYKCDACGGKFISNRIPKRTLTGTAYWCPFCNSWTGAKEDDSFLKAMVSGKQLENAKMIEDVQKEKETLAPFKAFFNVPCQMCKQPIKEWDDWNVKLAVQGLGCGHTACWNSEAGRMRELLLALKLSKDEQPKSQP